MTDIIILYIIYIFIYIIIYYIYIYIYIKYLILLKIHKRLHNVPGRPAISNNGYYIENIS